MIFMAANILVVDDEQAIADLVELYLKNEDYNVFKLRITYSYFAKFVEK